MMIEHIIMASIKVMKDTKYEDDWYFYHDALSQLTCKGTVEWMKLKGYYRHWVLWYSLPDPSYLPPFDLPPPSDYCRNLDPLPDFGPAPASRFLPDVRLNPMPYPLVSSLQRDARPITTTSSHAIYPLRRSRAPSIGL